MIRLRRRYLGVFLLLSLGLHVDAAETPPNIIVFLADDLGYGDLACFGSKVIKTPNLDQFATEGAKLTQCYSASAVCSPSRSAILTGRTPYRNGVYTWINVGSEVHLRTSEVALPKLFKANGYDTCHVGKWHLNGLFNSHDQPQPDSHGYDYWLGTQNNAAPSHKNPTNFVRNGKEIGPVAAYSGPFIVAEAIEWLKGRRDKSRPFFLAVWTHEPHLPIESDPRFQELYRDISDPNVRQHHGDVTQLDHAFGMLMKSLDEQKLTDSTFVVFTSDNGPEGDGKKGRTRGSTGGLRGRKRALYEGGIRVPGLIRWPGKIKPGTTCDVPIIGSDLYPTLLAVAGVKAPVDRVIDGVDVLPVLTGRAAAVARKGPLYWRLDMAPHGLRMALREGDWKLLADQTQNRYELYNLKNDPKETIDLHETETQRFANLRNQLKTLNAQVESEGPDWWKRLDADGGKAPKIPAK